MKHNQEKNTVFGIMAYLCKGTMILLTALFLISFGIFIANADNSFSSAFGIALGCLTLGFVSDTLYRLFAVPEKKM